MAKKDDQPAGRPPLPPQKRRVPLSTRVEQQTRDWLDGKKHKHDNSIGKTLDAMRPKDQGKGRK